jgi:hypothetical protein
VKIFGFTIIGILNVSKRRRRLDLSHAQKVMWAQRIQAGIITPAYQFSQTG